MVAETILCSLVFIHISITVGHIFYFVDDDKYSQIINLASTISDKWNVFGNTLTVIYWDNLDITKPLKYESALEIISLDHSRPPQNYSICGDATNFDKTSMLIFINDLHFDINIILKKYYNWIHYKRATLLMTFVEKLSESDNDFTLQLKGLFNKFFKNGVVTVIVFIWSYQNSAIQWYTYNFFTYDLSNSTGRFDFRYLYYENTKNFNGLKIKACVFHNAPFTIFDGDRIKGPELEAFYTLTNFLNISNHLVETQSANTSSVKATLNYARNNSCDVFFSKTIPLHLPGMANLPYPSRPDYICIFLPKGNRIVGIRTVLSPFQKYVWTIILVNFLAQNIFWLIIKSSNISWHSDERFIWILDFLKILLNTSADLTSLRLVLSSKIFIAHIIFCGCLIAYAYQSVLVSFLVRPIYTKDITTLEGVENSGFKGWNSRFGESEQDKRY